VGEATSEVNLSSETAEVEAARARLGHSLAQLEREGRAQIGYTVERILWKVAAAGAAVVAGIAVRKGLTLAWRAARNSDPPSNLASKSTPLGEALAWTAATGVGIAVARLVAERGAAAGWEKATGSPPPQA
jgi:predicted anti-sigma-YlaC factor YlaD